MQPEDDTFSDSLSSPAHPPQPSVEPRYVPVLSEVIGLSAASIASVTAAAAPDLQDSHIEASVQDILRALGPEFDQRLAETMSRVLHEQLQGLHARIRQAVAREVRAVVMAALTEFRQEDDRVTSVK